MRCPTCNELIDRQAVAATWLHHATTTLVRLAGKQQRSLFDQALRLCDESRNECTQLASAFTAHCNAQH